MRAHGAGWLAIGVLAVAVAWAPALAPGHGRRAATVRPPRCFGAASRDPRTSCHNPRLRYTVRPRPSMAQLTPNEPCERLERWGPVHPCAFGAAPEDAVTTIALIGDSHASHWRAALRVAADVRRWRGISITNGICPVSAVPRRLPPAQRRQCDEWNETVLRWLRAHPEVTVVVHAQLISRKDVEASSARTQYAAKVSGYRRVWHAFPPTVRHIVAMRDNPKVLPETPECVMRARARRLRPGVTCALPRDWSLRHDPLAAAAHQTRSRRVDLVDLTHFFCGPRVCYPVVGGALVHKDEHHLTRMFSTSLGPYLLRRLNHLIPAD